MLLMPSRIFKWARRHKRGQVQFLRRNISVNLALQGGGAHGAFTWGVLDRLLEENRVQIGWISATSAGAVNAVALAAGLMEGGREAAREKLFNVWHAVHKAGVPDLMRLNPFLSGFSRSNTMANVASLWSPYDFNPLGFDPLRRLLEDNIDFAKLRTNCPIELLIAATVVSTGRPRLFRRHEMSVEAVLASACLPTIHHAVEVDGTAYWDGGFSANPDLINLGVESPVADTLIVQLSPLVKQDHPRSVADITAHANRLQFNLPLLRDVEVIMAVRQTARGLFERGRLSALAKHRFHLIDATPHTGNLAGETAIKPDWGVITFLHGAGRAEATRWLETAANDVGRHESIDLEKHFLAAGAVFTEPDHVVAQEELPLGKGTSTARRR